MGMREPVCFTCGEPVVADAFQNRLEDGTPCPACRARLLDEAPSLLPRDAPAPVRVTREHEASGDYTGPRPLGFTPDDDGPIGA